MASHLIKVKCKSLWGYKGTPVLAAAHSASEHIFYHPCFPFASFSLLPYSIFFKKQDKFTAYPGSLHSLVCQPETFPALLFPGSFCLLELVKSRLNIIFNCSASGLPLSFFNPFHSPLLSVLFISFIIISNSPSDEYKL